MSAGQEVPGKFTCLFADVELRGTVSSLDGSTFDVTPDPNYAHMVSAPWWSVVHCETYSTTCRDSPEWDANNNVAPALQVGEHVVLRGAWVYDNVIHTDEVENNSNVQFYRGTLLTWRIKTEIHPYLPSTVQPVAALEPGDTATQTLTLVAPRYTEVYADTHGVGGSFWNTLWGYADHVVEETLETEQSVQWFLPAPPPPAGAQPGVTHDLAFTQDTALGSAPLTNVTTAITNQGLAFSATLNGSDILNPARFQATFSVWWQSRMSMQLACLYASESMLMARYQAFSDAASNSLDAGFHRDWALGQIADDAESRLTEKVGELFDALNRQGNDAVAGYYADAAVHLVASGAGIGAAAGLRSDDFTSVDWNEHHDYALNLLDDPNAILPGLGLALQLTALVDVLWQQVVGAPANVLFVVFTSESVYLAELGGYANPARNSVDPSVHHGWAAAQSLDTVRDDLIEKYNLQFDRLAADITTVAGLYGAVSVRLNAFAVDFGSALANSSDINVHVNWALTVGVQYVKDETARRIRVMFDALS